MPLWLSFNYATGPRQVGKTFLLNEIENTAKKSGLRTLSYNLEIPADLIEFNKSETDLFRMLTTGVVFSENFTGETEYSGKPITFMKHENIQDFIDSFFSV